MIVALAILALATVVKFAMARITKAGIATVWPERGLPARGLSRSSCRLVTRELSGGWSVSMPDSQVQRLDSLLPVRLLQQRAKLLV